MQFCSMSAPEAKNNHFIEQDVVQILDTESMVLLLLHFLKPPIQTQGHEAAAAHFSTTADTKWILQAFNCFQTFSFVA